MTKRTIKYDRRNFRKHSAENKAMIRKSLEELGAGRSVVVDADDELIAGNGVYEQAEALGLGVKVVETDGSELVVVKRTDLHTDDDKRKRLAYADNASSDHVEWNIDVLVENISSEDLDAFHVSVPEIVTDDDEIERKRKEFAERMEAGELDDDDPEYQDFIHKFEAKKTTDDCYTPDVVYEAVADWVANEYGINRRNFVRPFYPGGDYQKERYKADDVVVDNPPFSILSQIVDWYKAHGIRFFLFGPSLTLFGTTANRCTCLPVDVSVTYANGANVLTSFITNLEPEDVLFRSAPTLYARVKEANDANLKQMHKEMPKYAYPLEIVTTPVIGRYSRYGIDFVVRRGEAEPIAALDAQKAEGKSIYGKGYLLGATKKAEREKAEREKAEREKAEREKAISWKLSERELEIQKRLK